MRRKHLKSLLFDELIPAQFEIATVLLTTSGTPKQKQFKHYSYHPAGHCIFVDAIQNAEAEILFIRRLLL